MTQPLRNHPPFVAFHDAPLPTAEMQLRESDIRFLLGEAAAGKERPDARASRTGRCVGCSVRRGLHESHRRRGRPLPHLRADAVAGRAVRTELSR
jgi:hypothetical protein